jgi:hypothetical protein
MSDRRGHELRDLDVVWWCQAYEMGWHEGDLDYEAERARCEKYHLEEYHCGLAEIRMLGQAKLGI